MYKIIIFTVAIFNTLAEMFHGPNTLDDFQTRPWDTGYMHAAWITWNNILKAFTTKKRPWKSSARNIVNFNWIARGSFYQYLLTGLSDIIVKGELQGDGIPDIR